METSSTIMVDTKAGKLQGIERNGLCVFKGVPYAQPPVGPLRFKPSLPKTAWTGVLDCTQYGPVAPQRIDPIMNPGREAKQDEAECLNLNVWTPAADGEKRPVLFWIHGGGFSFGSGSWDDGSNLAKQGDAVVVTINYRVGIFGFLYVENQMANLGITDMITALKWVKDNIAAFGGDRGNVTIFGESAGAVAVCCLMAMPDAKGLFQKAISESGTAHPRRHHPSAGIKGTAKVMAELGIEGVDVEALSKIPTETIVAAQTKLELQSRATGGDFPYGVYVDGKTMPKHPYAAIQEGYAKEIAFMIGTNLDEARLYSRLRPSGKTLDDAGLVQAVLAVIRPFGKDENDAKQMIEAYEKERTGNLPSDPGDLLDAVMTDLRFRMPALRWAEAQSKHQPNVFSYLFTYKSSAMGGVLGACHALEIPFVFGVLGQKERGIYPPRNEQTDTLSAKMLAAWTAFARTGNPSHDHMPPWAAYEVTQRKTMILGIDTHLEEDPFGSERALWNDMI
ncbi:MAG: carboxylesterase/lipase family protein [Proteobacteria bacterium]|nr:carboxylesterase/lipase family protein [Pseudomonadota bacterium]MBU4471275.1 carboxylesterase/lipase family protein [Pseudomonadota bacterium]MCG2753895.1 carboxylesterase/lipase family protein [Desulfobacteraceae bacterium]